jgi:hypothetical protein
VRRPTRIITRQLQWRSFPRSVSGAYDWGQTRSARISIVVLVLILAAGSICAAILGVVLLILLDLVRGKTRWQARRRFVQIARARIIERVGRTPEELTRDRAAALRLTVRQVDRMVPEVLGEQLRQAMLSRGASPLQAYYLRSPASEDFLAGREPLPTAEVLARDAVLEHLVTDGIALPHDHEYLAAKARMAVGDWIALPYTTRKQVVSRLFDLTTEMPHILEDVDKQWHAVFLRRGLSLQEWRSIPVLERRRAAEVYLADQPEVIALELEYRQQEVGSFPSP